MGHGHRIWDSAVFLSWTHQDELWMSSILMDWWINFFPIFLGGLVNTSPFGNLHWETLRNVQFQLPTGQFGWCFELGLLKYHSKSFWFKHYLPLILIKSIFSICIPSVCQNFHAKNASRDEIEAPVSGDVGIHSWKMSWMILSFEPERNPLVNWLTWGLLKIQNLFGIMIDHSRETQMNPAMFGQGSVFGFTMMVGFFAVKRSLVLFQLFHHRPQIPERFFRITLSFLQDLC